MLNEQPREGWFYKEEGKAVGPLARDLLMELVAGGRVGPNQPVWKQDGTDLTFVRAAAVANAQDGRIAGPALTDGSSKDSVVRLAEE